MNLDLSARCVSAVLHWSRVGAATVVLWWGQAAVLAAMAPDEQAMADWLKAQQPGMIELLERVVKIDSASENLAGVRAVGDLFASELKSLGLTPRWIPLAAESKRAGHLFAERTGTKGKRVLLIGHLDTVLPGGMFSRDGAIGRGSGVNDIKGGDVVLIYALKALRATGALDGTQIVVAMTGDEESIGPPVGISRQELIATAKRSDVALAFETGKAGEATTARRGSSSWRLEVTSPTGHSSGIFSAAMGSGAIYEAARILDGFHTELRKLPGLTANVSLIVGGAEAEGDAFRVTATGKDNIIPGRAIAHGDLRALSPAQLAEAEAAMQGVAMKNRPRAQSTLTVTHRYPPMASEPRHLEVLSVYDAVSRDLGQGPVKANDPTQRGAGDAAFAAPYCGVLDGLGVYGTGAHAQRESIDLNSLVPQTTRAALLIYRLTR
jgi:glutamate carboxypeptidase